MEGVTSEEDGDPAKVLEVGDDGEEDADEEEEEQGRARLKGRGALAWKIWRHPRQLVDGEQNSLHVFAVTDNSGLDSYVPAVRGCPAIHPVVFPVSASDLPAQGFLHYSGREQVAGISHKRESRLRPAEPG